MERILLLLKHKKNRSLLQEFLKKEYKVVIPQGNQLRDYNFDLIISDGQALKEFSSKIKSIKEELSVLLPVILVTSRTLKKIEDYLGNLIDELIVTPIKKYELRLRINSLLQSRKFSVEAQQRYNRLAENSPVGICVVQEEKIVYINPSFEKMSTRNKEEIIKSNCFDWVHPQDREKLKSYWTKVDNSEPTPDVFEIRCIMSDDRLTWVDLRMSEIVYDGIESKLLILLDITQRKKAEERINYLNYHDRLTDLYNRAYFKEELKRLDTARQLPLSIIMADVNGLKLVNDAFGHQTGDQLLKKAAEILTDSFREEDIVTRWGGDEFVILLPQTNKETAAEICSRVKKACTANKEPVQFSIALGTATKERKDEDIEEVLKQADNRMYKNKLKESSSVRHDLISSLEDKLRDKTYESREHIRRIKELALKLGRRNNLSESKLEDIELLARLHDIGKVAVPESTLKKSEELTEEEWETIKEHTEIGYNILKAVPKLASVAEAALAHHEWWDGSGYPQGLSGKDIPLLARILAIVDAYEIMTHERSDNHFISQEEAITELKDKAGVQLDPELVADFIEIVQHEE